MRTDLTTLLAEITACRICADALPHDPRPVVQVGSGAPIVIIGQAPGRRVHESGVPWDDPSGRTLRSWLGLTDAEFYDPTLVALVPMGFCFPGSAASGDLPPRPECAPTWHERVLTHLPDDRLTILIGAHAMKRYLPDERGGVTGVVADWRAHLPHRLVLPHPSPRNQGWRKRNPWFEAEVVPAVRDRVATLVTSIDRPSGSD